MKAKFMAVLMVLGVTLLMSSPALADTCAGVSSTTSFCLSFSNVTELQGFVKIQVDILPQDDGNTALHVFIAENTSGLTALGFQHFAYNGTAGFSPNMEDDNTAVWANGGSGNGDGFGNFTHVLAPGGNMMGTSNDTDITFTLNGAATFSPNDHNSTFAVHVRFSNGCSGWFSNDPTTSVKSDSRCGGTEIPEPGSLALLGTGLFSAVGVLRRKLLKA